MENKAQTTLEYAVLIGIIVVALLAMSVYMRRAMQGRLKDNADQISEGFAYSPKATNSHSIALTHSEEKSDAKNIVDAHNETSSDTITTSTANITTTVNRNESVLPFADEPKRW